MRNDFDQDSLHQIAADETLPPAVRLAALDRIRPFPWWTVAYVASVVAVNVLWGVVPWVGSFVVGAIFMVRDAAQEEIGTRVLWATAAGVLLSYLMASPGVALASAAAFAIGEGTDFLMCRWLRDQPLRSRMLITQPVNVAMDTSVFLLGLQMGIGLPWSWSMFGIQCASKMAALVVLTRRSAP